MKLRLYNSLTGRKEEFKPLTGDKVGMYVCGITAYDECHIGHARAAMVFDAIVRYLRCIGFKVCHVQNFTDIDDKIINRAREVGVSSLDLSERYIAEFHQDMAALGVLRPDMEPKATEHTADIISLINGLIRKGHAYAVEGSVYFSVETFPPYGKLSHRSTEEMLAGARVEIDPRKRNPMDFALWKAGKPGEPTWESPWGPGRPGWHIECSAMSIRYLGETLDIHGGGKDLIFPHHENEVAQSEAATGKPFVRYFVHNGFVTINGEKMSKSLGNFLTIKQVLSNHDPEALRLFLLSKHYRKPLDYSEEFLKETETSLDRVYTTLNEAITLGCRSGSKAGAHAVMLPEALDAYTRIESLPALFKEAMDDDFNTAQALAHVFDAIRSLNVILDMAKKGQDESCTSALCSGVSLIREAAGILGLLTSEPEAYLEKRKTRGLEGLSLTEEDISRLIQERNEARKRKDWAAADAIRQQLDQIGIVLKDSPKGTAWEVK